MSDFPFWDVHTHVQFSAYDADRAAVINRAAQAGVACITAGTERVTSRRAVELAEKYPDIFAAIGLHPTHTSASFHDADESGEDDASDAGELFDATQYRKLAFHPKTVAIGECGLDYFRLPDDETRGLVIQKQKDAFLAQIALAREVRKPLVIHCRSAFDDLIGILRDRRDLLDGRPSPGVIHFFTGTADQMRELMDLGFSFTFGGAITFPPRKGRMQGEYDDLVRTIPPDRILSETDAPYVAPIPHRGERNEPAYVPVIVAKLAELKKMTVSDMAAQIRENVRRIFQL